MTDKQIVDTFVRRSNKAAAQWQKPAHNASVVITQQYKKKLYFAVKFDEIAQPVWIAFEKDGIMSIFKLPELDDSPETISWKQKTIKQIVDSGIGYVKYDLAKMPNEIVHIFSHAVITALSTPGMSTYFITQKHPAIFASNETYEMIQLEADLMSYDIGSL